MVFLINLTRTEETTREVRANITEESTNTTMTLAERGLSISYIAILIFALVPVVSVILLKKENNSLIFCNTNAFHNIKDKIFM